MMKIEPRFSLKESTNLLKDRENNNKNGKVVRLRGRYLFRASVRLVLEYLDWIKGEVSIVDRVVSDGMEVSLMTRRKLSKEHYKLNIVDRSILLTQPQVRSSKDKIHINKLIDKLQAFKKYPDHTRNAIASVCLYQYVGSGRMIVRQNHPAHYLYYIINGHVKLTKIEKDPITGEMIEIDSGILKRGDVFDEVALLHEIPRSATVTTETPVDFLYIDKFQFDRLLRLKLLEEWNVLRDALVTFNYFDTWDETAIRGCCIISRIENFEPNEILLGDGKGMMNYVYFLLSGKCRLIEHMLILEAKHCGKIKYKLYNPAANEISLQGNRRLSDKIASVNQEEATDSEFLKNPQSSDNNGLQLPGKIEETIYNDRIDMAMTTLQDVVNQWHEISEVAAALMPPPSTLSQQMHPDGVKTIFMKICEFHRGACFGLGEDMRNRRIVSVTPVRCLLVPRYWLLKYNHANIWERVKVFMNSKYPSREKLFNRFVTDRSWMKYKEDLVNGIMRKNKKILNNTTVHDVPYSIRISEQHWSMRY